METRSRKKPASSKTSDIKPTVAPRLRLNRSELNPPSQPSPSVIAADPDSCNEESSLAPISKQSQLLTLLQSDSGATIGQMMQVTGWQAHSIRGYISAVLRKKLELRVERHAADSTSFYRTRASV
jgi:hypothetical protein